MTLEQREAGESGHIADHNEIADILTFNGWILDYNSGIQLAPAGNVSLDVVWDNDVLDTHSFHSGSDNFVTIPAGMEGWYDLRARVVMGNNNSDAELGQRFCLFARNLPSYDPAMGSVSQDAGIAAGTIRTHHLQEFHYLYVGDEVVLEISQTCPTTDINVLFDAAFHQDTCWMGRYLGAGPEPNDPF